MSIWILTRNNAISSIFTISISLFFHTYARNVCVLVCVYTFCNKLTWKLHSIHVRPVFRHTPYMHIDLCIRIRFDAMRHWAGISGLICCHPLANRLLHEKWPNAIKYLHLSFLTLDSKTTLNHTVSRVCYTYKQDICPIITTFSM